MASDIDWPADLPQQVLQQGFKMTLPNVTLRTDMDAGPAKLRRRLLADVEKMQVYLSLSFDQVDSLKEFFNTETEGGSLSFNMNHPVTGIEGEFRFTGPPDIVPDGARFYAIMGVELLP